jgi:class 3 adenylate cyclase
LSIEGVAENANVAEGFVRRLVDLGALPVDAATGFSVRDVRRARLLDAWEQAGLPLEAVLRMLEEGMISLAFLDLPSMAGPEPLEESYLDLSASADVPLRLVQQLHQALGFAPPRPEDRAREDDAKVISVAKMFLDVGVGETALLGLVRVYADSLRRVTKAEAELYESQIEQPLRTGGMDEGELIRVGTELGNHILPALEETLRSIYRRHREHVWIEHAVYHAEIALEEMGLRERVPEASAICFVDLTGYTRLTEERGDEVAAQIARNLSALVYEVSQRHGGRPIRWLGDGGMFHFREPRSAVLSGLEMCQEAPRSGLPPTHIGIHIGPVIYQDGDVYGKTVNLASRIASQASAGEVLVSEETVRRCDGEGLHFEALPPVELKGVAGPMPLYRATRHSMRRAPESLDSQ